MEKSKKQVRVLLIGNANSEAAFNFVYDSHTKLVGLAKDGFYKKYGLYPPAFIDGGDLVISDLAGNEVVFDRRRTDKKVSENYVKITSGATVNHWQTLIGLGLEEADLNQDIIIVDCLLDSPAERALLEYVLDIYKKSVTTSPFELYNLEHLSVRPEDWPGVTDKAGAKKILLSPMFKIALKDKICASDEAFYRAGLSLCSHKDRTLRALGVLLSVAAILMERRRRIDT